MRCVLLLFVFAMPSYGQEQDIQKQLIQRQQQSDAFTLQLRQSQEMLGAPTGRNLELESRQFSERQRLDNVGQKQLRDVRPDMPHELRPLERQRADDERRPLTIPSGGIIQAVEGLR